MLVFNKTRAIFFCRFGLSFIKVPFSSLVPKSWKRSVIFSNALMLYELLQHSKNTWLGPASVSPACCLQKGPQGFYTEILTGFVMEENRKDSELFQASGWLQTQLAWRGHCALSLSTDSEFRIISPSHQNMNIREEKNIITSVLHI